MVFDRVVQQRGAGYVRVGDPVAGDDPDRHPQQVIDIRFALPPVGRVQPRCQRQRIHNAATIGGPEGRDLHAQAFAQPGLAVYGGDRVQRHRGQQSPFGRAQPRACPGRRVRRLLGHDRLRFPGGYAWHAARRHLRQHRPADMIMPESGRSVTGPLGFGRDSRSCT
jgi:hypothetical protein